MKKLQKLMRVYMRRQRNKIDWLSRIVVGVYILTWLISIVGTLLHKVSPEFVPLLDRWVMVLTPFVGWILQRRLKKSGNPEENKEE